MEKESFTKLLITVISAALLLHAAPARGQANVNWDSDNGLNPVTAVIGPGGTVTWYNVDIYGFDVQITFTSGGSLSFDLQDNYSEMVTFPLQTGVYNYRADYAGGATQYGSVVVDAGPTVTITAPTNNAVFAAPATFTVQATASTGADVQFFLGDGSTTNLIADVPTPPYTTGITNLAGGAYSLIAIATDTYGMTATNAITVTVTGGTAVISNSPRLVAGQFLFDVTGLTAGKTNIVLVSTDLASWTPVQTNIASSASFTVTNSTALGQQFCRVLQLP